MNNYLVLLIACCIIPVSALIAVAFFAARTSFRFLSPVLTPSAARMHEEYKALQKASPNASRDELVQKVIHRQAVRCGWVGALTGVWGIFFLPFGMVIDIYTSLRIQAEMVYFIAYAYGRGEIAVGSKEQVLIDRIIATGGYEAVHAFKRVAIRIIQKTFSKLVPLAGALLGFGVNYALARATGQIAVYYYSGDWQQSLQAVQEGPAAVFKQKQQITQAKDQ